MLINLALGLAITATVMSANAQTSDIKAKTPDSAYLQNNDGTVVRSAYGLCWRTGNWRAADAELGCDGELNPPIAKSTAPAIAAPLAPATQVATQTKAKRCDFTATLENGQAFPFNSATLNRSAKNWINEKLLPQFANCAKITSIHITGHSDLLGSDKYNQQLSEKRATNLATYLKSKNIDPAISATGVGATQPVKVCDKKLSRKKRIACLAPNRRTTIEIKGTATQ